MRDLHLGYEEIASLTYPQAYQLMKRIGIMYKEQHKASESNHINQVLGQMCYGRK